MNSELSSGYVKQVVKSRIEDNVRDEEAFHQVMEEYAEQISMDSGTSFEWDRDSDILILGDEEERFSLKEIYSNM